MVHFGDELSFPGDELHIAPIRLHE